MDKPIPEKPSDLVMRLYGRKFVSLKVEYRATGCDTAETYWVLTDWNGKASEYLASSVRSILEVKPDFNSVARLNQRDADRAQAWLDWEKRHARDLAELKRLERKIYGKEKANGGG
jgi:hypothetical protein